ncbi:MAG: hypothetical protein PHP88_02330 [bacterium]|nr:hypothetical protein [bacterium]
MTEPHGSILRVACPCCNAALSIGSRSGVVTEWEETKDPRKAADLKDATKVLAEEKARVEARYREIVQADKEKGAAMERKFKEFLEKGKGEPPAKPLRDIDLD